VNAQKKSENAEIRVTVISSRLPEDQRKMTQIPYDIDAANRNIKQTEVHVEEVVRLVPPALDLLNRLRDHADRIRRLGLHLKSNITFVRNEINVARSTANLVR